MDETHSPERPPTERDTLLTPVQPYRRPAWERRVIVPGFELLEELGRGGMGVVYKARQLGLNRVVALKLLLSPRVHADERVRFLTEAEAVAAVKHPNVVQVYEFGETDGRPYLAMEFVDGGSLAKMLLGTGPLSPQVTAGLVEQITRGVQAAHEQGIVHRDIKPANILLANGRCEPAGENAITSPAGSHRPFAKTPKVSDFGIAKRGGAADLTQTGVAMGTPAYMSPEQARGQTKFVGPAADVYALGVILYECLTGHLPFDGTDSIELLHRVAFNEPPPVRKFAPTVPVDLELICLKCLQKGPHERYPTAAALADDLARFIAGDPVSVRPPGHLEKAARWVRKYPTRAAAYGLATLAVVLGVLAGGAIMLWRNADDARTQAVAAKVETDDALAKAEAAKTEAERERIAADEARHQAEVAQGKAEAERKKAETAATGEVAARQAMAVQKAAHDTDLAYREYEANNHAQALRIVAGIPASHQPWEARFVKRLCQSEAAVIVTGEPMLYAAAFVAGTDRVLATDTKTLREWDTKTSKSTEVINGLIVKLAASTSGKRFAAMGLQEIKVFERSPNKVIATISDSAAYGGFNPDANKLVYGSGTGGTLRDLVTGTSDPLPADELACWCAAISKEGAVVIGGQRWSGKRTGGAPSMTGAVKLWPSGPRGASVVMTLNTDAAIKSATFSPDGMRLAVGCDDGAVVVFDLATRMALKFRGHTSMVTAITYDPAGKRIAASSYDRTVRVWDAESGAELNAFKGHAQAALSVVFSPDGSKLVSASQDGTVRIWDANAPPEAIKLEGISGLDNKPGSPGIGWIQDITITDDGSRILVAQNRAPVRAFNARTGRCLWPKADANGEMVVSTWIDPIRKRVVGVTSAAGILDWDLNTGEGGFSVKRFPVKDPLRVSADLSRALTQNHKEGTVVVHDVRTGAVIAKTSPHLAPISRPAISANGRRLLTMGLDHKAIVWNGDTGAKVCELVGHIGMIRSAAFSPDGTRIATCGEEGVLKLWEPETGREVLTLRFPPHIGWSVGWSADGSKLVALDFRGVAHVWDAGPPAK